MSRYYNSNNYKRILKPNHLYTIYIIGMVDMIHDSMTTISKFHYIFIIYLLYIHI